MPGYRDRVIKLDFPDLSEDPAADPIWVVIRNPRLLPPAEIQSFSGNGAYERSDDGSVRVADPVAAQETMGRLIARLVVAARVYDAADVGVFDPETGEQSGEQQRLPLPPWDEATAAKLPLEIITKISQEFAEAVNPQKRATPATPKTSSSPPSLSTTEPGAVTASQPS